MGQHRGNDLFPPLLRCTAVSMRQQPVLLSLSLCHSLYGYTLYTCNYKSVQLLLFVFPKSYLYTYDFRAIYTYGPKGPTRTHLHMGPLPIGRENHHRALDHPVLLNFPSGGTCFPSIRNPISNKNSIRHIEFL